MKIGSRWLEDGMRKWEVILSRALSGLLLFAQTQARILDTTFEKNAQWGVVLTPDSESMPKPKEWHESNTFTGNPRRDYTITAELLTDIG